MHKPHKDNSSHLVLQGYYAKYYEVIQEANYTISEFLIYHVSFDYRQYRQIHICVSTNKKNLGNYFFNNEWIITFYHKYYYLVFIDCLIERINMQML